MRETLLTHLDAQPFRTMRIHLTNGFVHTVRDPDNTVLGPTSIIIAPDSMGKPGLEVSASAVIPFSAIARIEVEAAPSSSTPS